MFKVIWLMKRKEGMTHQQFRDHFENSHAPLAKKYIGHMFTEYRRNYPDFAMFGGDPRDPAGGFGPGEWEYDLISEWIMPDEAAFNEINRLFAEPEISQIFLEDENKFLDRKHMVMIKVTTAETDLG